MFVGEAPGTDEDAQGRPFVGAAGQYLDKIITACGLYRQDVFIANVLKCHPPMIGTHDQRKSLRVCLSYQTDRKDSATDHHRPWVPMQLVHFLIRMHLSDSYEAASMNTL